MERPGEYITTDWNHFFWSFLAIFRGGQNYHYFLTKKKRKNMSWPPDWPQFRPCTGQETNIFKGGLSGNGFTTTWRFIAVGFSWTLNGFPVIFHIAIFVFSCFQIAISVHHFRSLEYSSWMMTIEGSKSRALDGCVCGGGGGPCVACRF